MKSLKLGVVYIGVMTHLIIVIIIIALMAGMVSISFPAILTRKQFVVFIRGENLIFYVDGQRWRRRNYKTERKKSSNLPDDVEPRKYQIASASGMGNRVQ